MVYLSFMGPVLVLSCFNERITFSRLQQLLPSVGPVTVTRLLARSPAWPVFPPDAVFSQPGSWESLQGTLGA
jgi:hypothetical protein